MADYIVTVDDGLYDVTFDPGLERYNLGVNYEIPTKSTQYSNLLLDNISTLFNGIRTSFPLTVNGEAYTPLNDQQLLISLNDVVLSPGVDYQISGSTINFITGAPTSGNVFFGVAMATTADLTRTINFVLDNGSQDITPGSKGQLGIDVTGRIESWVLVSENTGSIVIDVRTDRYDTFPSNLISIVGSEYPRLVNQNKNRDESLSTWNDTITAGDILDFNVISCTGIRKCSLFLRLIL
jgi:hypothetical protein